MLGLKSAPKGDQPRKVWLGITTSSEHGPVVEWACALIPARAGGTGHADDIPARLTLSQRTHRHLLEPVDPLLDWSIDEERVDPLHHIDLAAPAQRAPALAAVHETTPLALAADDLSTAGMQVLAQASLPVLPASPTSCHGMGAIMSALHEGDLLEFSHRPSRNCQLALAIAALEVNGSTVDGVQVIFLLDACRVGTDSAITLGS